MPSHSSAREWAKAAFEEIAESLPQATDPDTASLLDALADARRVALHGVGREGLMLRAFAMRLFHLGLAASPVGDMTTPPVGAGDWLVVSAGPGRFSTVEALAGVARTAGAQVALLTAAPDSPLRHQADVTVVLPAQTMAADGGGVLPMGSAYEGALYFYFEYVVARLRERLAIDETVMRERHTNLE